MAAPAIGMGATVTHDGTVIARVLKLGVPDNGVFGMAESKRLDISTTAIPRIPTLRTLGAFTVQWEFEKTLYATLEGKKGLVKNCVLTLPEGSPAWTRTVPCVLTVNKIDDVEADAIMTVTSTFEVTGEAS